MKSIVVLSLLVSLICRDSVFVVNGIPFVGSCTDSQQLQQLHQGFGLIRNCIRGGSKSNTVVAITENDYERAEKAILKSIERVEAIVEKAVANEVDLLFHTNNNDSSGKEKVTSRTKKAVTDGVNTVKSTIKGHSKKSSLYPFETTTKSPQQPPLKHNDHRVLTAIEAAERAVLQAITNEVDTLFHETEHHHKLDVGPAMTNGNDHVPNAVVVPQAKTKVKDGIIKASTVMDNVHHHRRDWLQTVSQSMIEDYSIPEFFLE